MALFGLLTKPKPEINAGVEACARTSARSCWTSARGRNTLPATSAAAGICRWSCCPPPRRASCRTGARRCTSTAAAAGRSRRAAALLKRMGYTNVTDIGGIADYRGRVVR